MTKLITYAAMTAFFFGTLLKSKAQNTFPATGSVGIGTTSPLAYLHVVSPNGSTTPLFEASEAGTNSTWGDFFKIGNGTSNTTTFTPYLWGHNAYYPSPIAAISLIGSTSSQADVTSTNAIIGLNARQLNSGTSSPILNRNIFQVNNYTKPLFTIASNGSVGIGTTTPSATLEVINSTNPNFHVRSSTTNLEIAVPTCTGCYSNFADANSAVIRALAYNATTPQKLIFSTATTKNSGASILFASEENIIMTVKDNNTVGIGTSCIPSDGILGVNGKIYATALQIKLTNASGCFPDYVFEKDYKLMSLNEVEKYIKTNKHLPEVPAAERIEENGIDVAGMDVILLKKIEELTLYIIDIKKENETLKQNNKTTESKLNILSQQIQALVSQSNSK